MTNEEEIIRRSFRRKWWNDVKTTSSWSVFKIMSEFVQSFEKLAEVGPCVAIFGSARTKPDDKYYKDAVEIAKKLTDLGFGIITSSMTTKYRDLQVLFSFIVSLWMYATPIVYPLSQVAGRSLYGVSLKTLMCLNPVTPIIETFKYGTLGAGEFVGWGWLGYSLGFAVVVLLVGVLIFNRVQKSFMDTV